MFFNLQEIVFVGFRKKVQEVNWQRKSEQTRAGETLKNLEERLALSHVYRTPFKINVIVRSNGNRLIRMPNKSITHFHCSWVGFVSKNYEIERACVDLENEIQELEEKRKEASAAQNR